MPLGGNITWTDSSLFTCPIASLFSDGLNGLYGPNSSYTATYGPPFDVSVFQGSITAPCAYLTSSLQFGCTPCPAGTYALIRGQSNGAPGNATNPVCNSCPFGGVCINATVLAQPGYWGAANASSVVSFTLCPSGYCYSSPASCVGMASCAGSRTGTLCGDCMPGYVEAMGSTLCVHASTCASDKALFWPLFVLAMFVEALIQLAFVSDVWNPSAARPDATVKCLLYFYQVR